MRIISSSVVLYTGRIQPQKDMGNLLGLCFSPRIYLGQDLTKVSLGASEDAMTASIDSFLCIK